MCSHGRCSPCKTVAKSEREEKGMIVPTDVFRSKMRHGNSVTFRKLKTSVLLKGQQKRFAPALTRLVGYA